MSIDKEASTQLISSVLGWETHTQAILSSISDAVITADLQGRVEYMNQVAERLTGWSFASSRGESVRDVFNVLDEAANLGADPIIQCLREGEPKQSIGGELVLLRKDGRGVPIDQLLSPIKNKQGQVVGVVVVFRDVSHSRKLIAQLQWQASHDILTGLVNRTTFDSRLDALLNNARVSGQVHAMLYLDLDQFKIINDTCGHMAGDELLRQVAQLLAEEIRSNDTLARLSGDEFGVLLASCNEEVAMRVANKIRSAIRDYRFTWAEYSFSVGASIGVVLVDQGSGGVEQVLSAADTACYAAKDAGRDQVHLFRPDEGDAVLRQGEMKWVSHIQDALDENRFVLYAQAIKPIRSKSAPGHFEVLVRMLDRDGKLIPPGMFIPAAERFSLMPRIDRWVVAKVFQLIERERDLLMNSGACFAINLSGGSVSDEETLQYIVEKVKGFSIPAGMVSFEVTETAAIANLSLANHFIRTLKQVGCKFSLDDFGSGLSSFAYLKNLPVDYLKIDGAFVRDLVNDPIDRAMVDAINQVGQVMSLQTIAEFVENDEILKQLQEIGVDYAQGFGVAKPTPLADGEGNLLLDLAG